MDNILLTVKNLSNQLQALLPMKPEDEQRLEKKIRLELNYNSNHLEGNTLTYGETELLLIFGKTTGNHEAREYKEMEAHDTAYEMIKQWAKDKDKILNEADIRHLNEIILVQPFWKEAVTPDGQSTRKLISIGSYKQQPNSVRLYNGEIFHYTSVIDTPILMQELIDWFRNEDKNKELQPVIIAAMLHYRFVRIHPFDDGNGRISRLLMNYVLLKNKLPPVIIKSSDKKNYLFALNLADTGNIDAFNEYIANQLLWSLELYIKAANGESIEEQTDIDKRINLLTKKVKNNQVATLSKTPELIYQLLRESIFPLLIDLEKNCEKLKPLFIDYSRAIYYKLISAVSDNLLGSKESDWTILKNNWLENKIKLERLSLDHLTYLYSFLGFKSNIQLKNLSFNLVITFLQYSYEIKINQTNPIHFSYNNFLSKEDQESIIKSIINYLLDEIEKFS